MAPVLTAFAVLVVMIFAVWWRQGIMKARILFKLLGLIHFEIESGASRIPGFS
jgi:hypothetical protein